MNRIVSTVILCFAACNLAACGTTTSSGGGGAVLTDTQGTVDTGLTADTGATGDTATGTDATTADVAANKDTAPTDMMTTDMMATDMMATDTAKPDVTAVDTSMQADVAASGACTNSADKTILDSGTVQKATTDCAMQSMGDATKAAACVKTATGLSDGCSTCFAGILSCTFKNCLTNCMGGQTPACSQCMADKGCNATFTTCAGVSP